jgi:hypothetical protein
VFFKSLHENNYIPVCHGRTCCEIGYSKGEDTLCYLACEDHSYEKFATWVSYTVWTEPNITYVTLHLVLKRRLCLKEKRLRVCRPCGTDETVNMQVKPFDLAQGIKVTEVSITSVCPNNSLLCTVEAFTFRSLQLAAGVGFITER